MLFFASVTILRFLVYYYYTSVMELNVDFWSWSSMSDSLVVRISDLKLIFGFSVGMIGILIIWPFQSLATSTGTNVLWFTRMNWSCQRRISRLPILFDFTALFLAIGHQSLYNLICNCVSKSSNDLMKYAISYSYSAQVSDNFCNSKK